MNLLPWVVLGLAAGLLASRLAPESRTWGPPAVLALIGIGGAVTGGWTASIFLVRQFAGGFLSPATWPAAIAGAVALLAARWILTGRQQERGRQAVTVPARLPRQPH
jgi:uncharacterized membrane protein YeaQ/YmgE (transglycosylase-associated protein family)